METEVRELCRKLKPIYGRKVDALWCAYLTEDLAGKREIETTLSVLAAKVLGESFEDDQVLLSPPPQTASNR